jgi:transcriptional regulator with XRE-family HTH domain
VSDDADVLLSRIGLRVLKRRQELGLTQTELADKLEMNQANVARIEHGEQNLTVRTLVKLAAALNVTAAELFVGTPPQDERG